MVYFELIPSPIGQLLVTANGESLTGLYLENHKGGPAVQPAWRRDPAKFAAAKEQLARYFAGDLESFDLPISLEGTPFQMSVWKLLQEIPYGQTTTYGEIARQLGDPNASRAVGTAVGRNPISIIVPCHRVLGAGGTITGYAGGVERKRALLDLESRQPALSSLKMCHTGFAD
ncbi:MAG TPA: methylated-DNA--[protein]-cysteine S-methyltransferase [Fimbriimonadaceae bacterium]|nr:methylated-DNA--[protein]-cysteine S-methyltransferase [Fimbriimonadaceae bacterium]